MGLQFHCPVQERTIDEHTCRAFAGGGRFWPRKRGACRKCNLLALHAAETLFERLDALPVLKGKGRIQDGEITFQLHPALTLSLAPRGFQTETTVRVDCDKYGSCHETLDGDELYDALCRVAAGQTVFVSRLGMDGRRVVARQRDLLLQRKALWDGLGAKVIDHSGVYALKEYGD